MSRARSEVDFFFPFLTFCWIFHGKISMDKFTYIQRHKFLHQSDLAFQILLPFDNVQTMGNKIDLNFDAFPVDLDLQKH